MKVLFDTDVILDLLLDRQPHSSFSAQLSSAVERGALSGYLCATSVTTVHSLATKAVGAKRAREEIQKLVSVFEIAPVNRSVLESALDLGFRDFENAVTHESARLVGAQAIVTRNLRDYRASAIPVHPPREMLGLVSTGSPGAE